MSEVRSAMAGTVWKVLVQPGETVTTGQDVVILESMKMEVPVAAEAPGAVREVRVAPGSFVNAGDVLVVLE